MHAVNHIQLDGRLITFTSGEPRALDVARHTTTSSADVSFFRLHVNAHDLLQSSQYIYT